MKVLNSIWKTPNPDVEWIKFNAGPAMDNKTSGSNLQIAFLKYSLLKETCSQKDERINTRSIAC